MGKYTRLVREILAGGSDTNIEFRMLCQRLARLGFAEKIRGSHHIFTCVGIEEILNLQPKEQNAKAYQVRQVRAILVKNRLGEADVG